MIWDCILCNIIKSIGYVFEQRYEKYVFYDMNIMIGVLLIALLSVLFRKKFLRLTMGFGYFMYSHSLVSVIDLWFSGRDN